MSEVNTDLPGLDRLLKQKQRLRKLWQETRDPACKTAVNWVTNAIRRMTRRRALERWETKIANTDVTSQAIWPIVKSLMKRDGAKEPTATADCLENQFTQHDLCDKNHKWQVETRVQTLLTKL
jgi:hypothetical protein